jgi:uncharacterized protein involved in oxidation of intracellular sulfur
MRVLIILNDGPYGSERTYNGLRLALALPKADPQLQLTLFFMGDGVLAAKAGQKTPEGFYNVEHMLHRVHASHGKILVCGSCMDARGFAEAELTAGAARSSMDALAAATAAADKVLVF